jgi:vacuolar-type H+-ATPase subunit I/STV1
VSQNPSIDTVSLIEIYKMFLFKERSLYVSLNKLKKGDKLFTGYGWIPKSEVLNVLRALDEIKESNRNVQIPNFMLVSNHDVKPPSFFRINEFTYAF